MTTRGQNLRSSTPGNKPAAGARQPGEIWINFADRQLGYIDAGKASQSVVAVRYFVTTSNYAIGDFVVQAGSLWVATAAVSAGAFNSTQWSKIAATSDIPVVYVLPTASTSVLGGVKIDGTTIKIDGGGVISSAGLVAVATTPPVSPQNGSLWYDLMGGQLYAYVNDGSSSQWVIAVNSGGGSGGASIWVGDTPPVGPLAGALWFDSVGGQLYVWFNDGSSNQWVPTTNQFGGGYQSSTGVTDGSNAAPGQLGEVISSVVALPGVTLTSSATANVTSLTLTPGDWDVSGEVWLVLGSAATQMQCAISGASLTFPGGPSVGTSRAAFFYSSGVATTDIPLRTCRISTSTGGTWYLVANVTFPSGTTTAAGVIWARRAR